jgi:hypothetical protein
MNECKGQSRLGLKGSQIINPPGESTCFSPAPMVRYTRFYTLCTKDLISEFKSSCGGVHLLEINTLPLMQIVHLIYIHKIELCIVDISVFCNALIFTFHYLQTSLDSWIG